MGTTSNLCGLLCLIALLGHRRPDRDLLVVNRSSLFVFHSWSEIYRPANDDERITNYETTNNELRTTIVGQPKTTNEILSIAKSQIGIREATGNNDGVVVEQYLAYTGNKKGEPWCASFVSWVFGQAGFKQPRTAWSPSLFLKGRLISEAKPASVFGIYFPDKGRIAHAGLVERQQGSWINTIEGNTNVADSREGDGVYRKLRHVKTIKYYADWINMKGGGK